MTQRQDNHFLLPVLQRLCFFCVGLIFALPANAGPMQDHFLAGSTFGNEVTRNPASVFGQKGLPKTVPGYQSDHPAETRYQHRDVKKIATQQLNDPLSGFEGGKFVNQQYHRPHKINIDPKDTLMTESDRIVKQSHDVLHNFHGFCAAGTCVTPTRSPSPDFQHAVSALSGTAAAGKDFTGTVVFQGEAKRCRIVSMGYSNCCANKGWGQDLGLAGCRAEEKTLGQQKQAGVCVYLGRYCSHRHHAWYASWCTEHSRRYCCFHSTLGRIIQQKGRGQVGLGFGSAKHPDCRGLTPEQLGHIDLSNMDFSDYASDLTAKTHPPDIRSTQQSIQKTVLKKLIKGTP